MKIRNGFVSNSSSSSFVIEAVDRMGESVIRILPNVKRIENGVEKKRLVFSNFKFNLEMMGSAAENFVTDRRGERYSSVRDYCARLAKCIPEYDIGVEEEVLKIKGLITKIVKFDFTKEESYTNLISDIQKLKDLFDVNFDDSEETPRIVYSGEYDYSDPLCSFIKEFEKSGHIKILEFVTS